ncbi:hypothetical protein RHMOL_Rhmol05G0251600 [Rhododendron molle]|uniref:Uncharacterized protein n=1 Tax=Rhododendron molle TaxID=49168 RepID=A0ACC0NVA2_RHOML|nr:hypothetical protein RHMOL_Rhmol05G0251600 [Rhododendron molle]
MKDNIIEHDGVETSRVKVHCCRFMDEMVFVVSGSKDVARAFKSEIQTYLEGSLFFGVDKQTEMLPCNGPHGIQFLSTLVTRSVKECPVKAGMEMDHWYKLLLKKRAEEYISSKTASLIALLPDSNASTESVTMTEIIAPVNSIKRNASQDMD